MKKSMAVFWGILSLLSFGCTIQPVLVESTTPISISERIPLNVALYVPEASRNLNYVRDLPGCINVEPPLPADYGGLFVKNLEATFSQLFNKVSIITTTSEGENYDAVIAASMTELLAKVPCLASPASYVIAKGTCRVDINNGENVWRSNRNETNLEQNFTFNSRDFGAAFSLAISSLCNQWVNDMIMDNQVLEYAKNPGRQVIRFSGHRLADQPDSKKYTDDLKSSIQDINFGRYYALVIGNNNYEKLPKLKTAVSDAKLISRVLRDVYDFEIKLILDGTRLEIVSSLDQYRRKLTAQDNFLIYYAGHGYFDEEAKRGYWLPVNAIEDTTADWISNVDVTDKLQAIKAKHVLVVADSCYSGTLTRGISIKNRSPNYLLSISKKRARTVMTSGGLEPVIDSGGGDNSVFAKAFYNELKRNTGILDGTQLFSNIRRPVMVNAPQTPQYSDIRFAGHEGGDFIFVRTNKP